MLKLFRWFCHPDYCEEIEGDLLEQFHLNVEEYGLIQAKWHFALDVFLLLRPEIMGNFHQLTTQFLPMNPSQWRQLIGWNALFVIFLLLRFLPGPPNAIVVGLSTICFVGMSLGILLSPISLAWSIVEIKRHRQIVTSSDNWGSGYRFAQITLAITGLFLGLALFCIFSVEAYFILPAIVLITFIAAYLWPKIKGLRQISHYRLNSAPFFILTLPVVMLLAHAYLVVPVNTYSRAYAIKKTEPLISAIEIYKVKEGQYPERMQDLLPKYLSKLPNPYIMGSRDFQYKKTADAYTLSFKINLGETDELVMYNKQDQHESKGHYASFEAKVPHWRYYWLD